MLQNNLIFINYINILKKPYYFLYCKVFNMILHNLFKITCLKIYNCKKKN